jgi:acyl-CoA thioester hydrolase
MSAKDELFRSFPVIVTQAVMWGEMDSFDHVNNVVYFRYFENGRIAYIDRLRWQNKPVGPILASTQAKFILPLTYPDTIHVGTRLLGEIGADRFTIEHQIVSEAQDAIVTVGQGVIVGYDYDKKAKAMLPDDLKKRMRALEASVNAQG